MSEIELEAGAKQVLDFLAAQAGPSLSDLPPEQGRQIYRMIGPMLDMADVPVAEESRMMIPGGAGDIPAARYVGKGAMAGGPRILFFHGGGFTIGGIDTHANVCRTLANAADGMVVSVDYRLAPEHPFPAAYQDALAATDWAGAAPEGFAEGPLFVAGDSAGGNLAAVSSLAARDKGAPALAGQILFYPVVDFAQRRASRDRFGEGYFLEDQEMTWFESNYLGRHDRADPRVSPLRADLAGLPPALVVLAECDPLVDEGKAYHEALEAAGVTSSLRIEPGQIHGFLNMGKMIRPAQVALDEAGQWARTLSGAAERP